MQVKGASRGAGSKTVYIAKDGDYTDEELTSFALYQTGESESSLFGIYVDRDAYDDSFRVVLHTD